MICFWRQSSVIAFYSCSIVRQKWLKTLSQSTVKSNCFPMVQILRVTINHPSTFNTTVDLDWAIQVTKLKRMVKARLLKLLRSSLTEALWGSVSWVLPGAGEELRLRETEPWNVFCITIQSALKHLVRLTGLRGIVVGDKWTYSEWVVYLRVSSAGGVRMLLGAMSFNRHCWCQVVQRCRIMLFI